MELVLALVIACVASYALAPALKKCPWAFYALAIFLDVLYLYGWFEGAPQWLWQNVLVYMQRCLLGISFFIVVMYVGAFDRRSALRMRLQPVRAELSILAAILCVGHIVAYGASYIPHIDVILRAQGAFVMAALAVASVLTVLLAALTVTSFNLVKRRMRSAVWKRLHMCSYLFYGLAFAHLTAFILPNIMTGRHALIFDYAIYTAVFAAYAILRIRRESSGGPSHHVD